MAHYPGSALTSLKTGPQSLRSRALSVQGLGMIRKSSYYPARTHLETGLTAPSLSLLRKVSSTSQFPTGQGRIQKPGAPWWPVLTMQSQAGHSWPTTLTSGLSSLQRPDGVMASQLHFHRRKWQIREAKARTEHKFCPQNPSLGCPPHNSYQE